MPWAVGVIAVLCFAAGVVVTWNGLISGLLVTLAFAVALSLRWYVTTSIEEAYEEGAGYLISTRARIRQLPQATTAMTRVVRREVLVQSPHLSEPEQT